MSKQVTRGHNIVSTFRLDHYRWTDGPKDRRSKDRQTDKASYRVACPKLKSSQFLGEIDKDYEIVGRFLFHGI